MGGSSCAIRSGAAAIAAQIASTCESIEAARGEATVPAPKDAGSSAEALADDARPSTNRRTHQ